MGTDRFEIVEVPEDRVATVRRVVPMAELPAFFDAAFHTVAAAVARGGGALAGAPFGWYRGMPAETVDVAAGFPVTGWEGDAEVAVEPRGGRRAVVATHIGPYETMAETYATLQAWCAERGLALAEEMWEEYLSEPTGDPSTWRTRITWPLA